MHRKKHNNPLRLPFRKPFIVFYMSKSQKVAIQIFWSEPFCTAQPPTNDFLSTPTESLLQLTGLVVCLFPLFGPKITWRHQPGIEKPRKTPYLFLFFAGEMIEPLQISPVLQLMLNSGVYVHRYIIMFVWFEGFHTLRSLHPCKKIYIYSTIVHPHVMYTDLIEYHDVALLKQHEKLTALYKYIYQIRRTHVGSQIDRIHQNTRAFICKFLLYT